MVNTIRFMAGLPRSGSTVLCNLLEQNPRIHCSTTSYVPEIVHSARKSLRHSASSRANPPSKEQRLNIIRGIIDGAYAHREEPVCIDKSRGWPNLIELLHSCYAGDVKMLVTVRDIREVIASFEYIHRRNADLYPVHFADGPESATTAGRARAMMAPGNVVRQAVDAVHDAINRGWGTHMYFVHYEKLVTEPEQEMARIYSFLGEEYYDHDFHNIEQAAHEDDTQYGYPPSGLHVINQALSAEPPIWPAILPDEVAEEYAPANAIWQGR